MELQPGDHFYYIERLTVERIEGNWIIFDDDRLLSGQIDSIEQRILWEIYNGDYLT